MTVKAIRLQNFMAFEDTGWIKLKPITLLFGRNSSGKSAIIRALRLLKQSLYALPDEGPLVFVAEEALDQGSFLETVHHQRVDEPMVFHFRCRLGKSLDGLREMLNRSSQRTGLTEEQGQNDWGGLISGWALDGIRKIGDSF
jgi:AAA15 family ATPase/GTPase